MHGHFKKNNVKPTQILAEFKSVPDFNYKTGQIFNVSLFSEGDFVSVSGKSKGRVLQELLKNTLLVRREKLMVKEIRTGMLGLLVLHLTHQGYFQEKKCLVDTEIRLLV